MKRLKYGKINSLLSGFPKEGIATSSWLEEHGYYKQQVKQYSDSGWLTRIGKGAYRRLNDPITWAGAVKALQSQQGLEVHVGGLSALALYGVTQYLQLHTKDTTFFLYNTSLEKIYLPAWFLQNFKKSHFYQKKLFSNNFGVASKEVDEIELGVSVPERAILEVLALTPNHITLEHASELMENLQRLRGEVVQHLLSNCFSVKVKRLFLCLSEHHNLAFFNELNLDVIDLGSGKRVIGEGGAYYPRWQLSLPNDFDNSVKVGELGE